MPSNKYVWVYNRAGTRILMRPEEAKSEAARGAVFSNPYEVLKRKNSDRSNNEVTQAATTVQKTNSAQAQPAASTHPASNAKQNRAQYAATTNQSKSASGSTDKSPSFWDRMKSWVIQAGDEKGVASTTPALSHMKDMEQQQRAKEEKARKENAPALQSRLNQLDEREAALDKAYNADKNAKPRDKSSEEAAGRWIQSGMLATPGNLAALQTASLPESYRAYRTAKNDIAEERKTVKAGLENDGTVGTNVKQAFKQAGREVINGRNWDFGVNDLIDNSQIYSVVNKAKSGGKLSQVEQQLLTQVAEHNEAQEVEEGALSQGYRAGRVAGQSVPFMAQFLFSPTEAIQSGVAKAAMRGGAKLLGKEISSLAGKQWLLGTMKGKAVKYTGELAGDLATATALTSMYGGATTMADAIERNTGQVMFDRDENGNVLTDEKGSPKFTTQRFVTDENGNVVHDKNGKAVKEETGESFGSALYKAFAGNVIENYTEMLGEHMSFMPKTWSRKMPNFLKSFSNATKKVGIHGLPGEIAEEEAGMVLNTALGVDNQLPMGALLTPESKRTEEQQNSVNQFWQQQKDIVTGIGLSMGMMGAMYGGHYAMNYYGVQRGLNKADKVASFRLTPDKWAPIKEKIDATETNDIPSLWEELNSSDEYAPQEKAAISNYMSNLQMARGFNIASMNKETTPEEAEETNEIISGHEATPEERNNIQNRYINAETAFKRRLGIGEDVDVEDWLQRTYPDANGSSSDYMYSMNFDGSAEDLDEDTKNDISEFFNARSQVQGMQMRMSEDVEDRVEDMKRTAMSISQNEGFSNSNDGKGLDTDPYILPAVLDDGSGVFIIDENRELSGSEYTGNGFAIVRDQKTGELKQIDIKRISSRGDYIKTNDYIAQQEAAIRTAAEQEQQREIEGTPDFNSGDTYYGVDEKGNAYTAQIVDLPAKDAEGNDSAVQGVSFNGMQPVELNEEFKQFITDDVNRVRRAQMKQESSETEAPAAETPDTEAPVEETPALLEQGSEVYALDDNGNEVTGTVTNAGDGEYDVDWNSPVSGMMSQRYTDAELQQMMSAVQNKRNENKEAELPAEETAAAEGQAAEPVKVHTKEQKVKALSTAFRNLFKHNPHFIDEYDEPVFSNGIPGWAYMSAEEEKDVWDRVKDEIRSTDMSKSKFKEGDVVVDPRHGTERKVNQVTTDGKRFYYNLVNLDGGSEVSDARGNLNEAVLTAANKDFVRSSDIDDGNSAEGKPDEPTVDEMPMLDADTPDYKTAGVERTLDYVDSELENDSDKQAFIDANALESKKEADKHRKKEPKIGSNIAKYKKEHAKWAQDQNTLDEKEKFWNDVNSLRTTRLEASAEEARLAAAEQNTPGEGSGTFEGAEDISSVPDWTIDNAAEARKRGYRKVNGGKVIRLKINPETTVSGSNTAVKFSNDRNGSVNAQYAVTAGDDIKSSHIDGQRNPSFFITEAQPKERTDQASQISAQKIAENINPQEITEGTTAYVGAPVVNDYGEAIQGNNRISALKQMYDNNPEQAEKYVQYIKDNADSFGVNAEDIERMYQSGMKPVLVRRVGVSDEDAIRYGQMTASDTESGGNERIKAENIEGKLTNEQYGRFNSMLTRQEGDDKTLYELIGDNGAEAAKYLAQVGAISHTQYQSMFDENGDMKESGKEDLKSIVELGFFKGGSDNLRTMFNALPKSTQRALLVAYRRDLDSPEGDRILTELQMAVEAAYEAMQNSDYAAAKNYVAARDAIDAWKLQYAFDFNGESYQPSARFSNFALEMAARFKGETQREILSDITGLFNLIQGNDADGVVDMFAESNDGISAVDAIKSYFNIEYNGTKLSRSNAVAVNDEEGGSGTEEGTGNAGQGESGTPEERGTGNSEGAEGNSQEPAEEVDAEDISTPSVESANAIGETTPAGKSNASSSDSKENKKKARKKKAEKAVKKAKEENMDLFSAADAVDNVIKEEEPVKQEPRRLVSDERMEELKKRMRAKLRGQLNMGIDPETLAIGVELAVGHIERGVTKFADYAKQMVDDLGDAIRPYLKAFYNGARDMPEAVENGLDKQMDSYDEVSKYDINKIGEVEEAEEPKELSPEELVDFINGIEIGDKFSNNTGLTGEVTKKTDTGVFFVQFVQKAEKNGRDGHFSKLCSAQDLYKYINANDLKKVDVKEKEENARDPRYKEGWDGDYDKWKARRDYLDEIERKEKKAVEEGRKEYFVSGTDSTGQRNGVFHKVWLKPEEVENGEYYAGRLLWDRNEAYHSSEGFQLGNSYYSGEDFKKAIGYEEKKSEKTLENTSETENNSVPSQPNEEPDLFSQSPEPAPSESTNEAAVTEKDSDTAQPVKYDRYDVTDTEYTNKKGKTTPYKLVKFSNDLTPEQKKAANSLAREKKGWYDRTSGGYMLRTDDDVEAFTGEVLSTSSTSNTEENETVQGLLGSTASGRTARQSADENGTLGEGERNEAPRSERRRVDGGNASYTSADGLRAERNGRLLSQSRSLNLEGQNKRNNHAERGVDYAPKSPAARYKANIQALKLSKKIKENDGVATPEQMAVLRKYSGWGGLGTYLNNADSANEIRSIIGDNAFEAAAMSANSAYFTPANVIDTLWDVAEKLGFKGGNVLEGSAGIGNIIGLMPEEVSSHSHIQAVEIDDVSGTILSQLYPDAQVDINGFEETKIPNGSVDLAITNVPFIPGFGVIDKSGDKDLSRRFRNIHDFCIAKNVRKLREGGLGIFITTRGTLDNSTKLVSWITNEGKSDIVGAFRLNNETFGGTPATSDIIVVRKRVGGMKSPNAIDASAISVERSADYETGNYVTKKGKSVPEVKHLTLSYNAYFSKHPENMGGVMGFNFEHGDTFRPTSYGLHRDGVNQNERLSAWVDSFSNLEKEIEGKTTETATDAVAKMNEQLGEGVKEGSMVLDSKGQICIARLGEAIPLETSDAKVKGHSKQECFKSYSAVKAALQDVVDYERSNMSDEGLKDLLKKLNLTYDRFVAVYGYFTKNPRIAFLRNDVDFSNIMALEKYEETGDKKGNRKITVKKNDVFSKRVVNVPVEPDPKNINDAVTASVFKYGNIDIDYISEKLGITQEEAKKQAIESGHAFEDPENGEVVVDYEYLCGNVREKLRIARDNEAEYPGKFKNNIAALEKIIPMNIPAHLIEFNIGSSWVDKKLFEEYVKDRTGITMTAIGANGTWELKNNGYIFSEKNRSFGVKSTVFNEFIYGTQLIEAAMSNRSITVSKSRKDYVTGKTVTETDKDATQACSNKIAEIRADFKEWAKSYMQQNPDFAKQVEEVYNDKFNNYVPKSIPKSYLRKHLDGANTEIKLYPHQSSAVVRAMTAPVLLAHEVGTGKTFTQISIAMEMRRLGTARKPMIVVQNATVGQFVASAKLLYPGAKVLTIEDSDKTAEGRKNFYAKIKYNDWDMIVVPQSVFERIPDSEERQARYIQDKINEKMAIIEQMKDGDEKGSMIVRQAEKELESLQDDLLNILSAASDKKQKKDEKRKAMAKQNAAVRAEEMLDRAVDDVENFDDMDIDAIIVDEAHEYKHLGFATAMQRGVKGVDPSYSKKSQGVYLKCQAVLEKNGGKNVVFATGTPISNTAAEIWTFMKYLMPAERMEGYGIYYFDDFVRNFGNIAPMMEFTTGGNFKEVQRFSGYVNLPELNRIWSSVADTVLTKDAEKVQEKIPAVEGQKAQDVYLPQSMALRSIMTFVKAELKRFEDMTGKEKKENSHIPLVCYGIAAKAAIDPRLVSDNAADDPISKTNKAVEEILKDLKQTKSYKGTCAVFCDSYRNKNTGFNIYEDIAAKLISNGVPADQIFIMKSGMSVKKKADVFDKVNRGDIRVILGSTQTLGTGVNIQERLHLLIHMDVPNRPMDYTQRNGRILRQGNLHKDWGIPVRVIRFGVEDSLDVTGYQRLKTKGAIADSIMHGMETLVNNQENRTIEEEEDQFGDTIAQLSGSQYALLKNQAERDLRKLENKKMQHEADQIYVANAIKRYNTLNKHDAEINEQLKETLAQIKKDYPDTKPAITVDGKKFQNIDQMADFFKEFNKSQMEHAAALKREAELRETRESERTTAVKVGPNTFVFTTAFSATPDYTGGSISYKVSGKMTYRCNGIVDSDTPVERCYLKNGIADVLDNVITGNDVTEKIEANDRAVERRNSELSVLKEREGKVFPYNDELEAAREKVDEYTKLMRKELEEKEAKYAEMDKEVQADNIDLSNGQDDEDETMFRDDDELEDNLRKATEGIAETSDINRIDSFFDYLKDVFRIGSGVKFDMGSVRAQANINVRGFYDNKTDEISVLLRGGDGSDFDLHKIIVHEKTHKAIAHGVISKSDVLKVFGTNGNFFVDDMLRKIKKSGDYEEKDYPEELVAYMMGAMAGKILGPLNTAGLKELCANPDISPIIVKLQNYIYGTLPVQRGGAEAYSAEAIFTRDAVRRQGNREQSSAEGVNSKLQGQKTSGEAEGDEEVTRFRLREEPAPNKTGIGYKVFYLKNGKLYPPMVANPNGADTPVGVWLDADAAPVAGVSKTGRSKVKSGGKGTQGGSGTLAYRPGWHLGEIPYALQFGRKNPETGERDLFPNDFVWAEVEYAADNDYQDEAMNYGINPSGKFQHSLAGLPRVPENGYYRYRTNPRPDTDPWIITGAMRVNKILKPSEVDELVREAGREPQPRQEGYVTDSEIEALNSEIHSREREGNGPFDPNRPKGVTTVNQLRNQAKEWAKRFGLEDVFVLHDNIDEYNDESDMLNDRKRRAKGWYNRGKIHINLHNHRNADDLLATIFHEAVAHYGLRKMVGKDNFSTFIDNIYNNVSSDIRREIDRLAAKKYNGNIQTATEEYLASLAEKMSVDGYNRGESFYEKFKDVINVVRRYLSELMEKVGVKLPFSLSDKELTYILWRSCRNLDPYNTFDEAQNISMQLANDVFEYDKVASYSSAAEDETGYNDDSKFRDVESAYSYYEAALPNKSRNWQQNIGYKLTEAYQDSMLSLKKLQEAIEKASGKPILDFENAYLAENRMSSMNYSATETYMREKYTPMLDEIKKLVGEGAEYEDVVKYAMAKHGIERNEVMLKRDSETAWSEEEEGYKKVLALEGYDVDDPDDFEAWEAISRIKKEFLENFVIDKRRDYSGLTSLFSNGEEEPDLDYSEEEARSYVDDFESKHDTSAFWNKVNAATHDTLERQYAAGLIDKELMDRIKGMFDYYVPLRGFSETIAEDMYSYYAEESSPFNAPIKTAKGRVSVADDPFANIGNNAESGIMQCNRNIMKQHLYRLARNHKNDLLTIAKQWYALNDITGEWEAAYPDLENAGTPAEYKKAIDEFESRMALLNLTGKATQERPRADVHYRTLNNQDQQHTIVVKVNGKEYNLFVNGNPKAAQAVNGQTNPDAQIGGGWLGKLLTSFKRINNWMARNFTSRNPAFILTNMSRDVIFAGTAVATKENTRYAAQYTKNVTANMTKGRLPRLIRKWNAGKLSMTDDIERYFFEFMTMGGETGYTNLNSVADYKNRINRHLREIGKNPMSKYSSKAWHGLWDGIEYLNRSAEDITRFTVYMTSRQMGRGKERAIWDAKQITVNFNKKGNGELGAGAVNTLYIFSNAAIQAMHNAGSIVKAHPGKSSAAIAAFAVSGMIAPALVLAMQALCGDDDHSYWDLPEWVRRNNLVLYVPFSGGMFVTIPLPHELRPFYGAGEMAFSIAMGKMKSSEMPIETIKAFGSLLPLDFAGNGGNPAMAMAPSFTLPLWQWGLNVDYFGKPIYKATPYNENMPEWTKAYKGTTGWLVDGTRWINDITGGNDVKSGLIDLNPAIIEHLFESYLGGTGKVFSQTYKSLSMLWDEDARQMRNVPVANSFIQSTRDDRNAGSGVSEQYFKFIEESEETERLMKEYGKRDRDPYYAAERKDLENSDRYARYSIIQEYKPAIDEVRDALKEAGDENETRSLQIRQAKLQKEIVASIEQLGKSSGLSEDNRKSFRMQKYHDTYLRVKKQESEYTGAVKNGTCTPDMVNEEIRLQTSPEYSIYSTYAEYERERKKIDNDNSISQDIKEQNLKMLRDRYYSLLSSFER